MSVPEGSQPGDSYRVLIVGCGQLGSRHLQAVASLPQVKEIEVVDPRPEALALGRERLEEIPDRQSSIDFRWFNSLEDVRPSGDLCIVATQADVRCQIIHQLVEFLDYSRLLLEKVVTQSVSQYESLMRLAEEKALSVWVNCKSRAHFSHKRVKMNLDPGEPVTFTAIGGNEGLANNGVHAADLFVFYDGTRCIESGGALIDQVLHPSKRGNGIFDLSGTLFGYSGKESRFILSYAGYHTGTSHYSVSSPQYRAVFDDVDKWFFESKKDNDWAWEQVPFEANLMVSNMTKCFAADILNGGTCELPTLQECFPAHRYILTELLPHFNKLSGVEGDRCPVT